MIYSVMLVHVLCSCYLFEYSNCCLCCVMYSVRGVLRYLIHSRYLSDHLVIICQVFASHLPAVSDPSVGCCLSLFVLRMLCMYGSHAYCVYT